MLFININNINILITILIYYGACMKILLINGSAEFGHSGGKLNNTLHKVASEKLTQLGHTIKETCIAEGYNEQEEVEKILWADTIIYQMAGWWMGAPWTVKKYIDEVFTVGHNSLYESDGRSRHDPAKQYGTGGLLHGRKYMLSVTWNAPLEAFEEFGNFFDGRGVEGVYYPFHKSQQFVGLKGLPSFLATNVIKEPDVPQVITNYQEHLTKLFG